MTMNNLAPSTPGDLMESVITKGDLSKLTPQERSNYYLKICESVGLNPLTKPFEYITLNGKLTLYALRNCTDQLRTIHGVSVDDVRESEREGIIIVTTKVRNKEGRTDIATGAVSITNLRGEALANALMKAETKSKRRATLSICGLGFLDETEIETIPGAQRMAPKPAPLKLAIPRDTHKPLADAQLQHDPETGEIRDDDAPTSDPDASAAPEGFDFGAAGETISEHVRRIDDALAIAAAKGSKALKEAWGLVEKSDQPLMKASLDRRHKPAAAAADKAAAIG